MSPEPTVEAGGLRASNPLGYLAALGLLEVLHRSQPDVRLSWKGRLEPRAVLHNLDRSRLIDAVLQDAAAMLKSPVLDWPVGSPILDIKVTRDDLSRWATAVADAEPWVSDQWCGLASEYALDNSGMSKPTHLHFTAGQQRFLQMVRQIADKLNEDRIKEALFGPWRYDSTAPTLDWDNRGERIYALRGSNPSSEKRTGVPAADWLAFRGLSFYPTRTVDRKLETAACNPEWKSSAFRWPVWTEPLSRDVARSVTTNRTLVAQPRPGSDGTLEPAALTRMGVLRIYQARISRRDPGGYGSFTPSRVLVEATP